MTTELAADRDAIVEVIGANFTPEELRDHAELEERSELERRRRSVSVEAVAGEPEAVAELEKVEAELVALDRRQELRRLADAETVDRAKRAAEAERAKNVATWQKAKDKVDKARKPRLKAIEAAIDELIGRVADHAEAEFESERLGRNIDNGYRHGRFMSEIEDRFALRFHEIGIVDLAYPLAGRGRKPLGEE